MIVAIKDFFYSFDFTTLNRLVFRGRFCKTCTEKRQLIKCCQSRQSSSVEEKFRSVHLKIIGRKMKGNSSQQFFRSWWLLFVIIKCKVFKVKVFKAVSHSSGPVIAMATGVRSKLLTINSTLSEGKTRWCRVKQEPQKDIQLLWQTHLTKAYTALSCFCVATYLSASKNRL